MTRGRGTRRRPRGGAGRAQEQQPPAGESADPSREASSGASAPIAAQSRIEVRLRAGVPFHTANHQEKGAYWPSREAPVPLPPLRPHRFLHPHEDPQPRPWLRRFPPLACLPEGGFLPLPAASESRVVPGSQHGALIRFRGWAGTRAHERDIATSRARSARRPLSHSTPRVGGLLKQRSSTGDGEIVYELQSWERVEALLRWFLKGCLQDEAAVLTFSSALSKDQRAVLHACDALDRRRLGLLRRLCSAAAIGSVRVGWASVSMMRRM